MSDGNITPGSHDGMGAFRGADANIVLIRNHEVRSSGQPIAPFGSSFDRQAAGGTTTLVVDRTARELINDFVSLSGTVGNCAGGATPWGTWISCEETTVGPENGFEQRHGYCFEVDPRAPATRAAVPIPGMGRFFHEAIAVDARSGTVFLTEDQPSAGFYRYKPEKPGDLLAGGELQMLGIAGAPTYDASRGQQPGQWLPVVWLRIADPSPARADADPAAVYRQGRVAGAANFRRLEGCFYAAGSLFFTSTDGGDLGAGQLWEYRDARRFRTVRTSPHAAEGWLRLVYESADFAMLKAPDNICVSQHGEIFICEDSPSGSQYVRVLTPQGAIEDFARNIAPGFADSEFAGAAFSPDGNTFFVNLWRMGATIAIWRSETS